MINNISYILLGTVFTTTLAQILLKRGAQKESASTLHVFLKKEVLIGWGIMLLCTMLNVIAMRRVDLKMAPAYEALSYIYVLFLGHWFLEEKVNVWKISGNVLIALGILVFIL